MKVKVWNENEHDYVETFRDKKIEIKAGEHIVMEQDEAVLFLGSWSPIAVDGDGSPLPQSFKKLRIEYPGKLPYDTASLKTHKCIGCGYQAESDKELQSHIFEAHVEAMTDEDAKQDLTEKVQKKRGRPAKTEAPTTNG